jgi:hypothetical protein
MSENKTVSPGLAFAISVLPGSGHFYLGLTNKGILLMASFLFVVTMPSDLAPLSVVIVFYAAFDALRLARANNDGDTLKDVDFDQMAIDNLPKNWTSLALGVGLVAAGSLLLLHNLGYYIPVHLIWPIFPIGLGLWLIVNFFRNNDAN